MNTVTVKYNTVTVKYIDGRWLLQGFFRGGWINAPMANEKLAREAMARLLAL